MAFLEITNIKKNAGIMSNTCILFAFLGNEKIPRWPIYSIGKL